MIFSYLWKSDHFARFSVYCLGCDSRGNFFCIKDITIKYFLLYLHSTKAKQL